jgi:hypothetical protein
LGPLTKEEGKQICWKDGAQALSCLLKYASKQPVAPRAAERKSLAASAAEGHSAQYLAATSDLQTCRTILQPDTVQLCRLRRSR